MPRKKNPAKRLTQQNLLKQSRGVTAIGRHSIKASASVAKNVALSPQGEGKARWSGKNLPKGFRVRARAGELPRHVATAKLMMQAYPGAKSKRVSFASELGFKWVKNMARLEELIAKKGDAGVLASWMDGQIPLSVMENPIKVGRAILRGSILSTARSIKRSATKPFVLNVSSSWFEATVLKALGIDYRSVKPKKGRAKVPPKQGSSLQETEALLFFHLPNGHTILSYRGRKWDVTQKLNAILK